MESIIMPRGYGKTTYLLRLAAATNIPILTMQNRDFYINKAKQLGIEPPQIIELKDIERYKNHRGITECLVDEPLLILQSILLKDGLRPSVGAYSLNN